MESKPTVEQFMEEFFRERTAALKMVLEMRDGYRRSYYHSKCTWDSRRGVVPMSEAEKIEHVSPSEIGAAVVTTGKGIGRSLYHVKSSGESWLIQEVDSECSHCRVFGTSTECVECGGTGWQSWRALVKRNEERAHGSPRLSPDEELKGHPFRDPAIEQFMTDHFRERTAILRKELEIHSEFAKRFYSPECDWTRWVVSFKNSEAERIVGVVPLQNGPQVTTHGNRHGLRYNLQPVSGSWLIWEVDVECPQCNLQGKKTDCFWCGGAGWVDAQAKKWRSRHKSFG